jgi:coenzyme F420-dependent glucose-6-phosphate dehydrogenase
MPRTRASGSSFQIAVDIGENEKDPAEFKKCVMLAEKLGFDAVWLGDHFMPWVHSSYKSAFVWSLIGSCLESTNKIKVGPFVTTPIGARYHPAIVAQASATLDNMYPGRFLVSVGTGEAVNEAPFFQGWPTWTERMERLVEGVQLMRKLWSSESYFDFEGKYFRANQIFLYGKPRTNLKVYFSGVGVKAAHYSGKYGDGLITLSSFNPFEKCRDKIFPSFDEGARSEGKNPHELEKIVSLSFTLKDHENFSKKERLYAGISAKNSVDVPDPRKIEQMGKDMPEEELFRTTQFCEKWSDVVDLISRYREIGVTQMVLQPGANRKLIKTYAEKILPHFRGKRRK